MSPKQKKAAPVTDVDEETQPKKSKVDAPGKAAMSGMVTAAKHIAQTKPNTPEGKMAAETLEFYQSLGRFDQEKHTIVSNWQKCGKKFTFWSEYQRTRTKASSSSTGGSSGWGTKFATQVLDPKQCIIVGFGFQANKILSEV
jgi:hypothetical protein